MKRLLLKVIYVVTSLVITVGILMGAWMIFFVNPVNGKNYTDFKMIDHILLWGSNGLIVLVASGLIAVAWWGLWKLAKRRGE